MMQVKNYWKPAKVTAVTQNTPRSYEVQTSEGQTYRRNGCHLRKVPNATQGDDYFSDDPGMRMILLIIHLIQSVKHNHHCHHQQ